MQLLEELEKKIDEESLHSSKFKERKLRKVKETLARIISENPRKSVVIN